IRGGCALMHSLLQSQEGLKYLAESKLLKQLAECLSQCDPVSLVHVSAAEVPSLLSLGEPTNSFVPRPVDSLHSTRCFQRTDSSTRSVVDIYPCLASLVVTQGDLFFSTSGACSI